MTQYITKPPVGTEIDWTNPLTQGLAGCWLFNEGAGIRANDLSGNGNRGTLTNMAVNSPTSGWGGGKYGTALQFDGVNGYVDVGNRASLNISNTGTISAWIYPLSIGIIPRPIYTSKGAADVNKTPYFGINMSSNDGSLAAYLGNGSVRQIIQSALKPKANTWQFVALIWNGTNASIYLNRSVFTTPQTNTVQFTGSEYTIGIYTPTPTRIFNGLIDEVCIWNRALSSQEVQQLYAQPFAMFRFAPSKLLRRR